MDRVPAPFAAALRRAGIAEVDDSRRRRAEYSSDASNYRVVPAAVVFPRSVDEVLATLDTCREHAVPLTARGAGTSIAGNAIGPGVVADFSRHLNQVLQVDRDARTAVVQPGAILDAITAAGSAARFAVRSRPVHACARHHRRSAGQQRLRIPRLALRAQRRQRRRRRVRHRLRENALPLAAMAARPLPIDGLRRDRARPASV